MIYDAMMIMIQMMMMMTMTEDDNDRGNDDNDGNRSVTNIVMNELSLLSIIQDYYYANSFVPLRGDSAAVIDPLMTSCISLRIESIASQNRSVLIVMILIIMMKMIIIMMMIMMIMIMLKQ